MSELLWYSGQLVEATAIELAIDDPGLLYGATVFTTLRIYENSLDCSWTNWKGHCDRIRHSLEQFEWQMPNWEKVKMGAEVLKTHYPVLRVTIFPDGRELITGRYLPADLKERQQFGIVAWLAEAPVYRRFLPEHKTGNYLSAWLALNKAQKNGAKEAILIDEEGNWLETSTGNLWGWQDGKWWTPPLKEGILPGLMRSQLIAALKSHHQIVEDEPWNRELVQGFEAIGYSNSVVQIVPIHTIVTSTSEGERITNDPCPMSHAQFPSHNCFQKLRQILPDQLPFSQIG